MSHYLKWYSQNLRWSLFCKTNGNQWQRANWHREPMIMVPEEKRPKTNANFVFIISGYEFIIINLSPWLRLIEFDQFLRLTCFFCFCSHLDEIMMSMSLECTQPQLWELALSMKSTVFRRLMSLSSKCKNPNFAEHSSLASSSSIVTVWLLLHLLSLSLLSLTL